MIVRITKPSRRYADTTSFAADFELIAGLPSPSCSNAAHGLFFTEGTGGVGTAKLGAVTAGSGCAGMTGAGIGGGALIGNIVAGGAITGAAGFTIGTAPGGVHPVATRVAGACEGGCTAGEIEE